ncbi:hypothetical protein [Pseudoalteromonas sp.]|uniref:hypothetical protein n=1 Tax=Pseudoalteromonas sp. TaxID=53249 RepID=UPI00272AAA27|nr:hypothetical protein [Pseudoalteromonas sp.]
MGKNWDWSYQKGREKRLQLEVDARMHNLPFNPKNIPLHSHDGTMQSHFNKGWRSVSAVDIEIRVNRHCDFRRVRNSIRERLGESNGR